MGEVRGLTGESLLTAEFQLFDRVLSVKDRILKTRSIPRWQQMLLFQGEMLNDQSRLQDLNLTQEVAVFDIMLKSLPLPEDMQALVAVERDMADGIVGMELLHKKYIQEVRALAKPPRACEHVCMAALHMLAGLAPEIPIKRDGSPKNLDWSGCKVMLASPYFVKQILDLPSCIDQGRIMESRVENCRQLIDALQGESESEKIQNVGRASLMCQQLIRFLIGVVKYYDSVAELRERFGGATMTELRSLE